MPVSVQCEQCGKRFQVADRLRGKGIKCRQCGYGIRVPVADTVEEPPTREAARVPQSRTPNSADPPPRPTPPRPAPPRAPVARPPVQYQRPADLASGLEGLSPVDLNGPRAPSDFDLREFLPWMWRLGGLAVVCVVLMIGLGIYARSRRSTPREEPQIAAAPAPPAAPKAAANVPPPTPQPHVPPADTAAPSRPSREERLAEAKKRIEDLRNKHSPTAAQTTVTGPPPANWQVTPDPLPTPVTLADESKLRIRVPSQAELHFPSTPSPFVALSESPTGAALRDPAARDHVTIDLWDLRTGERSATISSAARMYRPIAIAADGSLIAGANKHVSPDEIHVWSFISGEREGVIRLDGRVDHLDLVGRGLITLGGKFGKPSQLSAWDIKSGKQVGAPMDLGLGETRSITLSAGRRYLSILSTATAAAKPELRVFDLNGWAEVGRQQVPSKVGMEHADCDGAAFSNDGTQLTLLFTDPFKTQSRLLTFNASTGAVLDDQKVAEALVDSFWSKGRIGLQWLADGSGWLVGEESICNRQTGQRVYAPLIGQSPTDPPHARIFESRLLFTAEGAGRSRLLSSLPLEASKQNALAAKGAPLGALPPLDSDKAQAAPAVEVPTESVAWSVVPDPAPRLPSDATVKHEVDLKISMDQVGEVRFSDQTVPQLFVSHKFEERRRPASRDSNPNRPGTRPIYRYDWLTGAALPQVEIPEAAEMFAVSTDAKTVLSTDTASGNRLDVWSTEESKHLGGWEPYSGANSAKVAWGQFVDAERVLTASSTGKVILWQLPERQAVYQLESGGKDFFQLTGGRRYLITAAAGKLRWFETATGKLAGELSLKSSSVDGNLKSLAIRRDGQEAAALMAWEGNSALLHWDLQTGKLLADIKLPNTGGEQLVWCAGQNVGVAEYSLERLVNLAFVDLGRKMVIWTCRPPQRMLSTNVDDRNWFIDGAGFWPATLAAVRLPPDDALDAVSQAFAPGAERLFGPGSKVTADLDAGGDGVDVEQLRAKLREGLQRRSLLGGGSEPVRLLVRLNRVSSGGETQYRPFGFGGETFSVASTKLEAEVTMVLGTEVLYEYKTSFGMPMSVSAGKGSSPDAEVSKGQWSSAAGWLSRVPLPEIVVRGSKGIIALPGNTPSITIGSREGLAGRFGGLELEVGLPTLQPMTTSPAHPTWPGEQLAFNPMKGNQLVIAAAGDLLVCDPRAKKLLDSFSLGITADVQAMTFDPQGKFIVTGDRWGTIQVVDLNRSARNRLRGQIKAHRLDVAALAVSPDGLMLASSGGAKMARVWERASGKLIKELTNHTGNVNAVAYHPDGKLLATGTADGMIRLWNTADWTEARAALEGPRLTVQRLVFSPDGSMLAAGTRDEEVIVWGTSTWREKFTLRGHGAQAVAFSPDNKYLATASARGSAVKIWNATDGKSRLGLVGHEGTINAVAFSPDGTLLASVGSDRKLNIWEPNVEAAGKTATKPESANEPKDTASK